jgi:multiple sugar transport system permease protein
VTKLEAAVPLHAHRPVVGAANEPWPGEAEPIVKRLGRAVLGRQPIGLAFGAPYGVFIAVLFAYPLGLAVWISFHSYFFTAPGVNVARPFVGFANYEAVINDPAVRQALLNILVFLVINVPLTVVLSLLLATALNALIPFRAFFRACFYVPYVTASVAMVAVWLFMFNSGGVVNAVLGPLAPVPSWLVNDNWAMPSIAVYVTWKQLGFFILLYLAALQNVPAELYEAASMDGASWWHKLRAVTVPGVRTVTTLITLLAIIVGANLFTEPYLLTAGGGPSGKSTSPVLLMYQTGIEQNHPDFASALGVLLVLGVLAVVGVQRFVQRKQA